ncbi:hypothetical protein [Nocardia blacklockiae]|uniref:hypothetical protein n=1 Tax=Nocardia blacklockiae TaxID=480036 RepID=UPI0018961538|nr:hypothetical protein [Nocardia blacklockiae]MBF6172116.1 hypothetical protein [Nocardia blacklockiae]
MTSPSTPWSPRTEELPTEQLETTPASAPDPQPDSEPPRRRKPTPLFEAGMFVGIAIVTILLIAFGHDAFESPSSTPHAPNRAATSTASPRTGNPAIRITSGFAVGKVTANDGESLRVSGVSGSTTVVRTDTDTRVMVLPGSRVSDARPGTMVMVYGDKQPDGSIIANLLMGVTLPIPGR